MDGFLKRIKSNSQSGFAQRNAGGENSQGFISGPAGVPASSGPILVRWVEDFGDNSIDTGNWTNFFPISGYPAMAETNSQFEVTPISNVNKLQGIVSIPRRSIKDGYAEIRIKQAAGAGGASSLTVFAMTDGRPTDSYISILKGSGNGETSINLAVRNRGVNSYSSWAACLIDEKFRIVHISATNTVELWRDQNTGNWVKILETSSLNWTPDFVYASIYAGYVGTSNASTQKAIFDDVVFQGLA